MMLLLSFFRRPEWPQLVSRGVYRCGRCWPHGCELCRSFCAGHSFHYFLVAALPALLANTNTLRRFGLRSHARKGAIGADQRDIRRRDGRFLLCDAALVRCPCLLETVFLTTRTCSTSTGPCQENAQHAPLFCRGRALVLTVSCDEIFKLGISLSLSKTATSPSRQLPGQRNNLQNSLARSRPRGKTRVANRLVVSSITRGILVEADIGSVRLRAPAVRTMTLHYLALLHRASARLLTAASRCRPDRPLPKPPPAQNHLQLAWPEYRLREHVLICTAMGFSFQLPATSYYSKSSSSPTTRKIARSEGQKL